MPPRSLAAPLPPAAPDGAATDGAAPAGADTHPDRWRALLLLAVAELLGMSLWFAGSAVAPQYQALWGLTAAQAGWLTTSVQLGFVAGTAVAALLNLADVVPARRLFAASAVAAAAANAALLALPADPAAAYPLALACRAATGVALAGVYPPAMKMVATWFRARRGLAVGTVVGALTVGKATPYLVHAIPGAGVGPVVLAASAAALLAAALVGARYREGPYPFPPRPFAWGLVGSIVGERRWRLATGGYLGHLWELYAAWTWLPAFLAASVAARHPGAGPAAAAEHARVASAVSFAVLAVGGLGCVWGGLAADRRGRAWLVRRALAVSGACALLVGFTFAGPVPLTAAVALVWGASVIADSAQFSVLVTESVPPHAVGTALTLQTSMGFLLTAGSIQLVPPLAAALGWRWAFPVLALGPAVGLWCVARLARAPAPTSPSSPPPAPR
jgi:MFS family permease